MSSTLQGILAPMTTPFTADGQIDDSAIQQQVQFLLGQGVHGLVVGGSTGEGHALGGDELRRVVSTVMDEAAGRIPVLAGIIADSTREAIQRGQAVGDLGVVALQVTPVHYLFRPDDNAMVEYFRTVTVETGLPVIIYNVIRWNYLDPDLLCRILHEVPGVIGVKQSAGDLKLFADLLLSVGPDDLVLSAVDALMYPSFTLGAHGAVAAILSAVPGSCVELWNAVQAGDHDKARDLHGRLLSLWNAMEGDNLPACVKYAQSRQGCPVTYPRAPMPAASEHQKQAIDQALDGIGVEATESLVV